MELTQKEKDRLAELKAKEAKDAKSLTVAEQAELKALKAKKQCRALQTVGDLIKLKTRCCDARIESILLDVNEKLIIGSLW